MEYAVINRVREPYGCLGNMSPHPVELDGDRYPTAEALFQALRFPQTYAIREALQKERNPMKAKFLAKANLASMGVVPQSPEDVQNMCRVLLAKWGQHEVVHDTLLSTVGKTIVEDCTRRQRGSGLFWGAALQEDGTWKGANTLGASWEALRAEVTT